MRHYGWILGLLLLLGCGDREPATAPPDAPGDEILDPDPDGMPLPGNPEDQAAGSLVNLPSSPVPEGETQGALLTTRLRALLSPGATVQQVNDALAQHGAAIVSMNRGVPIVVLVIDSVSDLAQAEEKARALAETPAFLAVYPGRSFTAPPGAPRPLTAAFEPVPAPRPSSSLRRDLPEGLENEPLGAHLALSGMPAAWNARLLDNATITVLIADHFPSRESHPGIDPLEFSFYGGFGTDAYGRNGTISGNEGIFSAGLVGGDWDTSLPGIHPGPRLGIVGIPLSGLDLWEVSAAIHDEITFGAGQGRDRAVLLTGLTFSEADAEGLGALERASLALGWRLLVRGTGQDYESSLLHIVPGGDRTPFDDEQPLGTDGSYWSVAARFADLRGYLLSLDPTDDEVEAFDQLIAETGATSQLPLDNVLIVGASKPDGTPLPTGAQLTDVSALGEFVWGPCVLAETTAPGVPCDGEEASYIGTFAAAPQVAGLGAYLWSLAPGRSSLELHALIRESFHDGFVDAYRSVLALDPNLFDPRVRETLLDPNDDGRFDEVDVIAFQQAFEEHERARQQGETGPDYSRYDLNGDGFTGSSGTIAFDLDADRSFQTVSVDGLSSSFEEGALSDIDILCYYAHSDLYFGDEDGLSALLPECGGSADLFVQVSGVPPRVDAGEAIDVTVTAGYAAGGDAEGIFISLEIDGGEAEPRSGVTDASGTFRSTVTFDGNENDMTVRAWAETDQDEVFAEATTRRRNSIELVSWQVYADAGVFAHYTQQTGRPPVELLQEYLFLDYDGSAPLDTTLATSGSAGGAGMTVTGMGRTDLRTELDLGPNGELAGMSMTSETEGRITLDGPNFDLLSYVAAGRGIVDVELELVVWGDPASFGLSGNANAADYVVELAGRDGPIFECSSVESPCGSIDGSGALPPGTYRLTANHFDGGSITWHEDCTDCVSSGTQGSAGTMSLEFSVQH